MNEDTFKGQWNQMKGSFKQFWGDLTDDDITRAEGSYDKFIGVLQERYGWERERAKQEVDNFFAARQPR
jgi:uncharacterized protein YjbJ (UPF0337 family)